MKEQILILGNNIERLFSNKLSFIEELYSNPNGSNSYKIIRKISFISNIGVTRFLGEWTTVILFENLNAKYVIKYIRNVKPEMRIILWFWNSLEDSNALMSIYNSVDKNTCEIWSYNEHDCEKYNFNFNSQFYYIMDEQPNVNTIEQEVYYAGSDKNRSAILAVLKKIFDENQISNKIILTQYANSKEKEIKYSERISYDENLENIKQSNVIVDLVDAEKFVGQTLRPLEAAYYGKKLITNNPDAKLLKFYSENNIYVFDDLDLIKDNGNELIKFIKLKKCKYVKSDVEYYSFKNWLSRFFEG